jgi:hypothetical protein
VQTFVQNGYRYPVSAETVSEHSLIEEHHVDIRVATVAKGEGECVQLRLRASPQIAGRQLRYTHRLT